MNAEIRKLPAVENRVETGPVQFGDDWPGVFIRGDNAGYFAMQLKSWLDRHRPTGGGFSELLEEGQIRSLQGLLAGCILGPAKEMVSYNNTEQLTNENQELKEALKRKTSDHAKAVVDMNAIDGCWEIKYQKLLKENEELKNQLAACRKWIEKANHTCDCAKRISSDDGAILPAYLERKHVACTCGKDAALSSEAGKGYASLKDLDMLLERMQHAYDLDDSFYTLDTLHWAIETITALKGEK